MVLLRSLHVDAFTTMDNNYPLRRRPLIEHHAVDNYPLEQGVSEGTVGSPPLRVSDAMEQVAKGEGIAE